LERIRDVLKFESARVGVQAVSVNSEADAKALLFPGSPTVRINGVDLELNEAVVPRLACRLYANRSGVASEALLRSAISAANEKE